MMPTNKQVLAATFLTTASLSAAAPLKANGVATPQPVCEASVAVAQAPHQATAVVERALEGRNDATAAFDPPPGIDPMAVAEGIMYIHENGPPKGWCTVM